MKFKVYTSADNCNWCIKAKMLLNAYHQTFEEIIVGKDITKEEFRSIIAESKKCDPEKVFLTVPQIFVQRPPSSMNLWFLIGGWENLAEFLEDTVSHYGH
jgi:glutaredoxin